MLIEIVIIVFIDNNKKWYIWTPLWTF